MVLLRALLAALLVAGTVHAGFDTSCTYSQEWVNNDKRMENTVDAPLSGCQAATLGFSATNDILIGGDGSAEVIGIDAGSGDEGCGSGGKCMMWCQALCCMSSGCAYATIRQDKKTTDYVVYKETVKKYYCRMYKSGKLSDSDSQSTCTKKGSNYCDDLALSAFGLSASQYNSLVALAAYSTCPSSGRRLAGAKTGTNNPRDKQVSNGLAAFQKRFSTLKSNAKKAMDSNKMNSYVQKSGICPSS